MHHADKKAVADELAKDHAALSKFSVMEKARFYAACARLRYLLSDLDGAIKFQQNSCDALKDSGDETAAKNFTKTLEFYNQIQKIKNNIK